MADLQRTAEWFEDRRGCITASNFHKVLARHKRTGAKLAGYEELMATLLAERITGIVLETPDNEYMKWGRTYESVGLTEYTLKTGLILTEVGFSKLEGHAIGASPDGEINNLNAGVELKCPWSTKNHIETVTTGRVPEVYIPQVQGQIWVKGYDFVDFISYDPRIGSASRIHVIRVHRDDAYIKWMEENIFEFEQDLDNRTNLLGGWKK